MDAKARFRLSQGAKLHSTWHNPNWNFNPSGSIQMSPPQSPQRHGSLAASPPLIEFNYLCIRPQFDRSTKRIVSPAFIATTNEPRVATVSSVIGPSPTRYSPKLQSNGKEWDFADLNGAELMQMSAFKGRSPCRSRPQDWGKLAERSVAKADKAEPPSPGPQSYAIKHPSLNQARTISKVGREGYVVGARQIPKGPSGPGPMSYDPLLLPSGKEWNFTDLNGAERMEMSAFTSRSDARATPQQWARGNLIAPNHSLHDDRPWLGPGSHDPAYHSIDATFGLESALRRKATRIRSRRAIRTVRPAASQRALELFACSASGRRRLHHSSTEPLLRPVTAPF
jgi:hypothetical protein